jgi:hypothetical protein
MAITSVTRRALVADLGARQYAWSGAMEESDFLCRLYPLAEMASTDGRYDNALADIVQHRVANYDWDDDWVFTDDRLGLGGRDDVALLRFLAETVHPEVRPDQLEVQALVASYNDHLRHDGWELYGVRSISGRPVFGWRAVRPPTLTRRQVREAIADAIRDNLRSYDVAEFCSEELGLEPQRDQYDDPHHSKRGYVLDRIKTKNEGELLSIARRVLTEFHDDRLQEVVNVLDGEQGGVRGELKNLIFAADGPKPEIVLRDAINNVIEITANGEYCLVYDRPLDDAGLTWRTLVAWWNALHPAEDERRTALDLHSRLLRSLNDGPEKLILSTYASFYKEHGFDIPALIPQVYLHFDPYAERERGRPGPLTRQRMDFLLLLPRRRRVVLELDGKQHYSDESGLASPKRYAEMMREDRSLRLAGYEVLRIGGYELVDRDSGVSMLRALFSGLFELYGVRVPD